MKRLICYILAAATLAACGTGADDGGSVPRRRAYPRLPEYGENYTPAPGAAARYYVNSSAELSVDSGGRWITVRYPLYDAEVYVTVSRAASQKELQAVLDNRRERMALNIGGAQATTEHVASPDSFVGVVVGAPGTVMPVQFVATDGVACVVSGAARLNVGADAPYDSISPVVRTLSRDITFALKNLSTDD